MGNAIQGVTQSPVTPGDINGHSGKATVAKLPLGRTLDRQQSIDRVYTGPAPKGAEQTPLSAYSISATENETQEMLSICREFSKTSISDGIEIKPYWSRTLAVRTIHFDNGSGKTSEVPAVQYYGPRHRIIDSNGIKWQLIWCPLANDDYGVLLGKPDKRQYLNALKDLAFLDKAIKDVKDNRWGNAGSAVFPKLKLESDLDSRSIIDRSDKYPSVLTDTPGFSGIVADSGKSESQRKAVLVLDEQGEKEGFAEIDDSYDFIYERYKQTFDSPFKVWLLHKPVGAILFEGTVTEIPG